MKNKTVLVTGASRGIGKAIATKFAQEGYDVVINCRKNIDAAQSLAQELKGFGVNTMSIQADVSDRSDVMRMFASINESFGGVDVLVNNAGVSHVGLFNMMEEGAWEDVVSNNLTSVFACTHQALKHMVSCKSGVIINISSVWGDSGASCEAVYSATKGGINSFTKALAKELGPSNIRVNAVACGLINTDMNNWLSDEDTRKITEGIALGRAGEADEVADMVLFLATDKAKYVTGQVITVDGGMV